MSVLPKLFRKEDLYKVYDSEYDVATVDDSEYDAPSSVVLNPNDPHLRCITFGQGQEWGMELVDPPKKSKVKGPIVQSVSGIIVKSTIQEGDVLKSVNGKKIGFSYNAASTLEFMHQRFQEDGVLSIAAGNKYGNDKLIEVTIIKPKAKMTCEEMGLSVWEWSGLCIRGIRHDSILYSTPLKENDYIQSINDIKIAGTSVTPKECVQMVDDLPEIITIIVKRAKQKWTG